MSMSAIILKKRMGRELSPEEINFFIQGYTKGDVPDYQAAALLMAVYFQGFSPSETAALTTAMVRSGEIIDLSAIPGCKVDKHSTGGVGDKTTLVLAPLVAAAGAPVAKLAGRGLGHTGGTIDKLEAIPGFKAEMSIAAFIQQVKDMGLAVATQTRELAPADKKLYALRDVTATVESIPLIASSIMSKKLAAGADAIMLDVKTGSGALLPRAEDARELARIMVETGRKLGKATCALLTNMDQPLGRAVGNALEVREAIAALRGKGPEDLIELCLNLGAQMLLMAGKANDAAQAREKLGNLLKNGQALRKLKEMVGAQGGDPGAIDNELLLGISGRIVDAPAQKTGYVQSINAGMVGRASMLLGAGRQIKGERIDPSVGLVINKKIGEYVETGEALADIYFNRPDPLAKVRTLLHDAFKIGEQKLLPPPLVIDLIT